MSATAVVGICAALLIAGGLTIAAALRTRLRPGSDRNCGAGIDLQMLHDELTTHLHLPRAEPVPQRLRGPASWWRRLG